MTDQFRSSTKRWLIGTLAGWGTILLIPVGLMGLWGFVGHVFFAERVAAAIGWATSPFQFEVGMANLGIGLVGIIGSFWGSAGFRFAVAVMMAGFLGGAGIGHVIQIAETGDMASGNAGPILYTDFLTPIALFALLFIQRTASFARKLL